MRSLTERYKAQFSERSFAWSVGLGIVFIAVALVVNYYAVAYATESASNPVTDIILSNIPVFDVDGMFVWGPIIFWTIMCLFCLHDPKRLPFFLKCTSLFIVIRSIFVTLTHIGPFPDHIAIDPFGLNFIQDISSKAAASFFTGNDLFFSGHTGLPFLFALIFWNDRAMRYFCLIASVFFGAVVLLGHLHYSIDVLSAFFITYTIYHIAMRLFRKDAARLADAPIPQRGAP